MRMTTMMTLCITALLVAFSNANVCLLYKSMIKDPSTSSAQEKAALCTQFKKIPQDTRKQIAACSDMAKKIVQMIPTMCQTTGDKKTGDDKKTDGKKPGLTDEQKRQACKTMEAIAAQMLGIGVDFSKDPSTFSTVEKAKAATLCTAFKQVTPTTLATFVACSDKNKQLAAGAKKLCPPGDKKTDDKKTDGKKPDDKKTDGKNTDGKKPDDKKPGLTDEQKRQACKTMEAMMTKFGIDFSADPSTIDKAKKTGLCTAFKQLTPPKVAMFVACSDKNKQLVAGARKLCVPGDKKPDDKKPDDKKPGLTDEQKAQACKTMEAMMTKFGVDFSGDFSTARLKAKKTGLCTAFKQLTPQKVAMCVERSDTRDLKNLVSGTRDLCAPGDKKPDDKKPDDKKPDDKKPVRKPVAKKCEKPTAVNEANCKKENIAKVQDQPCRTKLIKDCISENKQDCKALTSAPSADKCTLEAIKSSLEGKPECLIPLRIACKSFLQKTAKPKTIEIPKDCTSWFDGCNVCTASKGKKTGCSKKLCARAGKAFCKAFESGKKCIKQRATGESECDKQGPAKKKPTCEDVTSNLKLSAQEMCLKASTLCEGKTEFVQNCEAQREKDSKAKCKAVGNDKRKMAYCCVQGRLETGCESYGSSDGLPSDCKTRCVQDGKLKVSDKTCVRCRGKDDLRPDGVNKDDKDKSKPFDPARVKETIKNVASGLNEAGKKCVKRVAQAASILKTQIQRWRNDPSKNEESADQVDLKSVADVQAELDDVADESEGLEDEFADDDKGKNYRKDNDADTLKDKMSDAADKKPKKCATEFAALRKAYNDIVDEYVGLPQKLKKETVERVELRFEDRDIGNTNLKDSKSVCSFAKKLVGRLKKAEDNHKKRLAAARKLVCTKAGALVKSKVISKLFTCLRNAKKAADAGSDQNAKDEASKDVTNFDNNGYKRVEKLLKLTAKKCLMKDTPKSKKARVAGLFRKTLKTKIKRKTGDAAFSDDDKKKIADEISKAVLKKFSQATNIETTFSSDSSGRRQLRPRRVLAGETTVSTTYDLDTPSKVADKVDVQLTDANVVSSESSFQPTSGSIEVSEPVTEINTELPSGEGEEKTTDTTKDPATEVDSTGPKEVVFATAVAICATILLV